jgi:hypothetical protein
MLRDQLVTIVSGTIFLFIGSASVCLAAARRQSQVRVFLWLGIWSGMYGARLLIESPAVAAALPPWIQIALPFLRIAFAYLLVPVVALAWLELSIDKMRLFLRVVILIGLAVAIVGVGFFVVTGSADRLTSTSAKLSATTSLKKSFNVIGRSRPRSFRTSCSPRFADGNRLRWPSTTTSRSSSLM